MTGGEWFGCTLEDDCESTGLQDDSVEEAIVRQLRESEGVSEGVRESEGGRERGRGRDREERERERERGRERGQEGFSAKGCDEGGTRRALDRTRTAGRKVCCSVVGNETVMVMEAEGRDLGCIEPTCQPVGGTRGEAASGVYVFAEGLSELGRRTLMLLGMEVVSQPARERVG